MNEQLLMKLELELATQEYDRKISQLIENAETYIKRWNSGYYKKKYCTEVLKDGVDN